MKNKYKKITRKELVKLYIPRIISSIFIAVVMSSGMYVLIIEDGSIQAITFLGVFWLMFMSHPATTVLDIIFNKVCCIEAKSAELKNKNHGGNRASYKIIYVDNNGEKRKKTFNI